MNVITTGRAVEQSVQSLPVNAEFMVMATAQGSSYPDRIGHTCTYGRVARALVTNLMPHDAIAAYIRLLEAEGWSVADPPPSPLLVRGVHERVGFFAVEDDDQAGVEQFRDLPAYRDARAQGRTVLILDMVYINPQRDGC